MAAATAHDPPASGRRQARRGNLGATIPAGFIDKVNGIISHSINELTKMLITGLAWVAALFWALLTFPVQVARAEIRRIDRELYIETANAQAELGIERFEGSA